MVNGQMGRGAAGRKKRGPGPVEEESEAQDVAQTLNSRPAGALAMARVQEELEREKERRSRAEARAERAEEASREAKATHA